MGDRMDALSEGIQSLADNGVLIDANENSSLTDGNKNEASSLTLKEILQYQSNNNSQPLPRELQQLEKELKLKLQRENLAEQRRKKKLKKSVSKKLQKQTSKRTSRTNLIMKNTSGIMSTRPKTRRKH